MLQPERIRLPPPEAGSSSVEGGATRVLEILLRGKWILLGLPLLAHLSARVWLDRQTPLYQATAQILVDAREVNPLREGGGAAMNKPRTVLKQQQQLLRSSAILGPLSSSSMLEGLDSFSEQRLGGRTVVSMLNESLTTTIDVESDRLLISFLSPFADEVGPVVEETVRVYLEYHREKKKEQAELLAEIVRREWERGKAELEQTTEKIAGLRAQHLLPAGAERTPVQARLEEAQRAWNTAHVEKLQRRAALEDLLHSRDDPEALRELGWYWRTTKPIPALEERHEALGRELAEKREDLERTRRVFGESNPGLEGLRAAIAELERRQDEIALQYGQDCLKRSEVALREAERLEQSLEADVRALETEIVEANRVVAEIADLERKRDGLRDVIGLFGERVTALEVENQVGALNLDHFETRVLAQPVWPDTRSIQLYADLGGAVLAFGVVLLRGLSDRRIREVEQVPALLGTSVLGVLPEMPGGDVRPRMARLVEEDPGSLAAEAIRSVRTATAFALPGGGQGVVLVTSAGSGEGKSVCASNLAFALARAGRRTLLVDGDMRAPAQHQVYGVANRAGLGHLLTSSLPLKKALVPSVAFGLDLLTAGDPQQKPAELCEGPVLPELLRVLREQYECVVIDGPPVLETSEARVLASLADAVVFVVRAGVTRAPSAVRALGILRGVGAHLTGTLVNGQRARRGARSYAGGISYGAEPAAARRERDTRDGEERPPERESGRGTDFLGLEEESA